MKKTYTNPEVEVDKFTAQSVLTGISDNPDNEGGMMSADIKY